MHLMYVDESGDTGYPVPGVAFPATGGPTQFFVRAGVIVHGWQWWSVNQSICDFKQSRGLSWDAEIKANHIRTGKGAFAGWTPADRGEALRDLLDTVGKELNISIIVVIIDKSKVDRSQRVRFTNPTVRSLELLLERYNQFLGEQTDRCGLVILDSVEEANDENLRYFQSYLRERSDHLDPRRVVEGTLFMPSHTTNMLQVADVCANVVYRHYRISLGNLDEYNRIASRVYAVKEWP